MRFSELVGNRESVARVKDRIREGSFFHACLIDGPEGVGKRRLAYTAAQAILCEAPREGEPCGECPACKKVVSGNHADLHYITTDGSSIKDEQIEEVQGVLLARPFDGEHTILIIDKADTMTPRAQNRMLKTLEEPPRTVTVFLLTEKRSDILPTILSRSAVVRLKPATTEEVEAFLQLQGASAETAALAAAYAGGCPGRAVRLLADEDFRQRRERSIQCGKALMQAGSLAEFWKTIEEDLADKEQALAFLDMLLLWFRDLLLLQAGTSAAVMNRDRLEELREMAAKTDRQRVLRTLQELEQTKQDIGRNANKGFAVRNLYLTIRG